MPHNALDRFKIGVGRAVLAGQNVSGIEDVETLILHGAEIEVAHGHDVEDAEVVGASEALLIPFHGGLETFHGPFGARRLSLVDIDPEIDMVAIHRGEGVAPDIIVSGTERKQVRGFGVWIVPLCIMAPV